MPKAFRELSTVCNDKKATNPVQELLRQDGRCSVFAGDGGAPNAVTVKGCTTVTIESIYFTQADILIYTISAPQVIIRPIFEECRVGIQSYSRGIVVGPFSDNPSCDVLANLTNNGMYFLGFPEGQHPVHYNVGTPQPLARHPG